MEASGRACQEISYKHDFEVKNGSLGPENTHFCEPILDISI
jgi:hypothetical protein